MATLSIDQLQPRNVGQKTLLVRVVHQSVYACEGKPGQSNYARAAGMLVDVGGAALFYTSIGDTVQDLDKALKESGFEVHKALKLSDITAKSIVLTKGWYLNQYLLQLPNPRKKAVFREALTVTRILATSPEDKKLPMHAAMPKFPISAFLQAEGTVRICAAGRVVAMKDAKPNGGSDRNQWVRDIVLKDVGEDINRVEVTLWGADLAKLPLAVGDVVVINNGSLIVNACRSAKLHVTPHTHKSGKSFVAVVTSGPVFEAFQSVALVGGSSATAAFVGGGPIEPDGDALVTCCATLQICSTVLPCVHAQTPPSDAGASQSSTGLSMNVDGGKVYLKAIERFQLHGVYVVEVAHADNLLYHKCKTCRKKIFEDTGTCKTVDCQSEKGDLAATTSLSMADASGALVDVTCGGVLLCRLLGAASLDELSCRDPAQMTFSNRFDVRLGARVAKLQGQEHVLDLEVIDAAARLHPDFDLMKHGLSHAALRGQDSASSMNILPFARISELRQTVMGASPIWWKSPPSFLCLLCKCAKGNSTSLIDNTNMRITNRAVQDCIGDGADTFTVNATCGGNEVFDFKMDDGEIRLVIGVFTQDTTSLLWQCEATRILRVPAAGVGTQEFEKECALMTNLPQPVPSAKRSFDCLHAAETTPRKIARLEPLAR
jgi:hypothetical protein